MDQEKLARLRQRYQGTRGNDIHDPKFARVASAQWSDDGRRSFPFSGLPTFLDLPVSDNFDDLDVAMIGVPMDLGVTNRSGARFGPRAIRMMERIGPYNHALDVVPQSVLRCADVGDVPLRSRFDLNTSIADIEDYFRQIRAAGVRPIAIGGDHSVSYPILKALGDEGPVGMIHIDAHCDTSGEVEDIKFHHGGPFRHAVLDGVLDPERTVQIGIRGSAEYLWEFSYDSGMTVIHAEEFAAQGVAKVIETARRVIAGGRYYISIDVDGIDPAFTPGTGTPEVGGLSPREVQALLRGMVGAGTIVGGDVVEVAPEYDANTNTAQVGAQMAFEILSLMAADLGRTP
ncbi:MAG: agmatinase [Rhodospirillaceae bacterium]